MNWLKTNWKYETIVKKYYPDAHSATYLYRHGDKVHICDGILIQSIGFSHSYSTMRRNKEESIWKSAFNTLKKRKFIK